MSECVKLTRVSKYFSVANQTKLYKELLVLYMTLTIPLTGYYSSELSSVMPDFVKPVRKIRQNVAPAGTLSSFIHLERPYLIVPLYIQAMKFVVTICSPLNAKSANFQVNS